MNKDKALKDVKTISVTSMIYEKTFTEIGLDTAVADSIKAFLWTDMKNLMYRYAKLMEYDISIGENTNILSYTDFDEISEYAIEAVQYAVGSGIVEGKTEDTLKPKDNATRAETAAIIKRFIESNK